MSATPAPDAPGLVPGRLARRKQQTRLRLLAAALDLFASQGFDATSYDEIAERADVARQTAFNYFPRKEDFLRAWIEQRRERLRELLTETPLRQAPATEQLAAHLRTLARFNEDDRQLGSALTGPLLSNLDPTLADAAPAAFADSVRLGQRQGEFTAELDPELVAEVIYDSYRCTLGRWLRQDATFPLADTLLAKLAVILAGVVIRPGG